MNFSRCIAATVNGLRKASVRRAGNGEWPAAFCCTAWLDPVKVVLNQLKRPKGMKSLEN